jgi:hypothetical protein
MATWHSDIEQVVLLSKISFITKLGHPFGKILRTTGYFVSFRKRIKGPDMKMGPSINAGTRVNRKPHIHIKTFFTVIIPMPNRDENNKTTFEVKTIKNFCLPLTPKIICLLSMQNQQQGPCLCGKSVSMTVLADASAKTDNLRIDESFRRASACIHLP